MTIFDRYLSMLFLKTVFVCFASFAGLFVVVHLFSNLDELSAISEKIGWMGVFQEFYLPRFADLFDKSAGIVILVAAIFSVSLMQRSREMTALEASGLTKARALRSIFVLSALFIALAVLNREFVIPQFKEKLVHTPQSWGEKGAVDMNVQSDFSSGVVLRGSKLRIGEKKITDVDVQLPHAVAATLPRVKAKWAIVSDPSETHPGGLWLYEVSNAERLYELGSLAGGDGEMVVYSESDQPWLGAKECFVRCRFDVNQMAYGSQLASYQSTSQLIQSAHDPSKPKRSTRKDQIAIHSRIVKPIMDMTLLLLGLPLVIGGIERNVFISAGICFWIIVAVQLAIIVCYALGASSLIRPAALAAWLPVLIFVPLAVVALRGLQR